MNIFGYFLPMESIYNWLATALSFLIVSNYSVSVYYGIRMIVLKQQNRYGWCPEMLVTAESIIWLILFGYIFTRTVFGNTPVGLDTFGVVYIRPAIFISACIRSILQRRRLLLYEQKLRLQKESKEGTQ